MKKNRTLEEIKQPKKMTSIGGQALMEGLMMIGPSVMAMAVRLPDGQIHVETSPIGTSSKAAKIPFIRGSVKIFRQMVTGTRYLLRSAQFVEDDLNQESKMQPSLAASVSGAPAADPAAELSAQSAVDPKVDPVVDPIVEPAVEPSMEPSMDSAAETVPEDFDRESGVRTDLLQREEDIARTPLVNDREDLRKAKREQKRKAKEAKGPGMLDRFLSKNSEILLYFSVIFGILFSVGLFILLPNLLTNLTIGFWVDKNAGMGNSIIYSLFEGVLRITIFIAYLALATNLNDIQRVWMYHGAEHKTISCYESGMPLNVENVRGFSKHHPRCGTAFMFVILIISIILFSFIPKINIILDLLIRLACVPIIASLAYEVIHWSARHDNFVTRAIAWPGLMLQRLTTKEPDDSMLEVAIAALVPVIPAGERGDEW